MGRTQATKRPGDTWTPGYFLQWGFLPPAAFGLEQAQCREHVTFEQ